MSDPFAPPQSANSFSTSRNRFRLRRVGVLSVGMFTAAAGVLGGLFVGLFVLMFSAVGVGVAGGQGAPNPGALVGMGAGAIIVVPLMYGILGFIGGVVNGFVYNILAGMTGGIELEFNDA